MCMCVVCVCVCVCVCGVSGGILSAASCQKGEYIEASEVGRMAVTGSTGLTLSLDWSSDPRYGEKRKRRREGGKTEEHMATIHPVRNVLMSHLITWNVYAWSVII